ncbi:hypothetical protein [Paenibacillus humicola]|nr:hypothetical protein [Paenibacillus humicola]
MIDPKGGGAAELPSAASAKTFEAIQRLHYRLSDERDKGEGFREEKV